MGHLAWSTLFFLWVIMWGSDDDNDDKKMTMLMKVLMEVDDINDDRLWRGLVDIPT